MIPLKNRTILTEHTQNNQIKEWLEIEIENKKYIYTFVGTKKKRKFLKKLLHL